MKALILASVVAATSPAAAATPEPSAAPDTCDTTTESRCHSDRRPICAPNNIRASDAFSELVHEDPNSAS